MNIDHEKMDILDMQDNMKELTDCVLDLYNKYPDDCKSILLEISDIQKDIEDIEKELKELEEMMKNEIY